MSDIRLTCDETPLAWPASIGVEELKGCSSCGIRVTSASPGSLQILTRRQGGVGDGVNIEESISVGADYRGQRYSLDEAVFHTPGLHVFPGMSAVYPAEYHVHMRTMAAPIRYLTLVIPVSHMTGDDSAKQYFAAMAARPDPAAVRPTLDTLLATPGVKMIQYQGPDIRGRSGDVPNPEANCDSSDERQFLLVLNVAGIRASDLERIPREGSLSTDPRDLPAPGVTAAKAVARDRLLRIAVLADPGILSSPQQIAASPPSATGELECKPIKVVNGRDVVDVSGRSVDIKKLLGLGEDAPDPGSGSGIGSLFTYGHHLTMFFGIMFGILLADWIFAKLWSVYFLPSARLAQWEPLKIWFFLSVAATAAGFKDSIFGLIGL